MIKRYFDENWRWENYKVFFQVAFFRYLVMWFSIVPIFANMALDIPDKVTIFIGNQNVVINLSLPFHWQLLWLSSVSFVVALLWYYVRCPSFITKYNSYNDYYARSHDPRWLAWETQRMWGKITRSQQGKFVKVMLEKKFIKKLDRCASSNELEEPQKLHEQTVFYFLHKGAPYEFGVPFTEKDASENELIQRGVFYEVFARYTESNIKSRWCIFVLLLISLALFLLALVQHLIKGASYLLN
ncbi:hypothetical protein [Pseudoalteromonas sp. SG45-2]|uniref:hypothetical protein n=1 Tax=Pseudoalteromonas sp. SG45-2 TaxID=2760956 RepID=UPI0015FFB01F|nr:hypothetical protein [Pseudoalteromonas sp. SG45-2]MBB1346025.1 hypothetical protein [Pseudoalteromonas sp. SG45-2]